MDMNRRSLLALLGSGSAPALPRLALAQDLPATDSFAHGIASGDPSADGAVIWTRASTEDGFSGDIALHWFVTVGPDSDPLQQGEVLARGANDRAAKVEIAGLEPGREYYYWFVTPGQERSPADRFRTLPAAHSTRWCSRSPRACSTQAGSTTPMPTWPRLRRSTRSCSWAIISTNMAMRATARRPGAS